MNFNDLSEWLIDYVAAYPEKYNQNAIRREPIMACARADERFKRLKEITVTDHALPRDLLPGAGTVVAWFIPFTRHIQRENVGGGRPALSWGRAYVSTNRMIKKCIEACPIGALSEDGMGRAACYARLRENYHLLMAPDNLPGTTDVCAKCQVGMPCSMKSPLQIE